MVEQTTFKLPEIRDDGSQEWSKIKKAFQDISEVLNEHADEMKAIVRHDTRTISYIITDNIPKTIIGKGKHFRAKITNAYVMLGDSVPEATEIQTNIADMIKFSATEKMGKIKPLSLIVTHLHYTNEVTAQQTGKRRLLLGITLESEEERK